VDRFAPGITVTLVAFRGRESALADAPTDDSEVLPPAVGRWRRYWDRARSGGETRSIKPSVVMAFSRQLSSFLEAGIPILSALEIVAEETASDSMREVIDEIRESILRGSSFSAAASTHSTVFPSYYLSMLVSAEYTGHLDDVLAQLASYMERDIGARRQVKSALTYPIMVLIIALVAMVVMSIFVLPKFGAMYESLGSDLPLPTRMLLGFTDVVTAGWPFILGGVAVIWGALHAFTRGARGKIRRDRAVMHLPVIGDLFHLISLERFCRVLAALASAGVPLPRGVEVAANSTSNSIFTTKIAVVRDVLIRGGGLSEPMVESGLFPTAARQMIRVGEQTGALGEQLGKAASYYEREVAFRMKRATDLFEPTVILVVGLIVGFVAVAQVAAMYSIFGQVK
jgi:type IV pilus assembly protein PilC